MDEYIAREYAMKQLESVGITRNMRGYRLIANMPSADVAPVQHGRWIPIRESEITGWNPEFAGCDPIGGYQCSGCGQDAVFDCNDKFVLSCYCPNCGAKMDLEG